jgi:integrase
MQRGCTQRNSRKQGPDVWQFRWSETRLDGKHLYHNKIVDTVEQYLDEDAARRSVLGLVSELNTDRRLRWRKDRCAEAGEPLQNR